MNLLHGKVVPQGYIGLSAPSQGNGLEEANDDKREQPGETETAEGPLVLKNDDVSHWRLKKKNV